METTKNCASAQLAADRELLQLWDAERPFPGPDVMLDPDVITHVNVERAQSDGYHYLHESAIACHRGILHLCWANHREAEYNVCGELIRGSHSADGGMSWSPAQTLAAPPDNRSNSYNHPVLCVHQDRLWGFFTRWDGEMTEVQLLQQGLGCCNATGVGPQPATEIFLYDDAAQSWASTRNCIPGFIPFHPPMRMRDGNWILGGELFWRDAAVAISAADDFTRWQVVRIPRSETMELLFPETALIDQGDRLLAICRPKSTKTAPAAESRDCGKTWTPLRLSNFPLCESQPFAGKLADGRHYLITCNLEEGRHLLTIALTAPGGRLFTEVRKIRHQAYPRRRHFPGYVIDGRIQGNTKGAATEWSYPAAVEHDGRLYVSYTQGKEDCVLSIIPTRVL